MSLLKVCSECDKRGLIVLGEAGHTRVYFCRKCGETKTQYMKKKLKCKHRYDNNDICQFCGYEKRIKYT